MMLIAKGVEAAKSVDGAKVREAIENLPTYQGAFTSYSFSPQQHVGIVKNPYEIGHVVNNKLAAVQ
jgi:hypothetical protein